MNILCRTTDRLVACFLVGLLLAGCASINTLIESRDPSPYSGVRMDCQEISNFREYYCPPWLLLTVDFIDLPLSAFADTILLPYTIPHTGPATNTHAEAESGRLKQNQDQ